MKTMNNYLLGMDCGTTNIKAILVNEEGELVAEASRPSHFISPGVNMQEQDANEWWKNLIEIFRSLGEQAGREALKNVKGICISSHTVTMLPVDSDGNPLRNAITYQDSRSSQELHEIIDKVGMERFVQIVGGQPSVAFLPNKILWFRRNEPDLYQKTRYFIQASSYLNMKLTGEMTSDIDQAVRTQCLNVKTMNWSKEIADVIEVNLEEKMPPLKLVDEIIGQVTEKAASETGLKAGIPVVAGCSDAMAAMYATGISKLGEAGESSGTTSLVFVGSNQKGDPALPVTTKPCGIEGMPWVFDAPIQTSGAALKWYLDTFGREEIEYAENAGINVFERLNRLALETAPGANGLFFFPYLLGERAPLWNDYARGMMIGLGMETSRSDLIRAVFEGTSYALRHVMETVRSAGAKADTLRICGGGAKSRTWCQIKASVLNMPVQILDGHSGDVPLGDILIVGNRVGVFENLTEAVKKIVRVKETIEPNPEWARVYDELYPYYVTMYQHLDQDLMKLQQTMKQLDGIFLK